MKNRQNGMPKVMDDDQELMATPCTFLPVSILCNQEMILCAHETIDDEQELMPTV